MGISINANLGNDSVDGAKSGFQISKFDAKAFLDKEFAKCFAGRPGGSTQSQQSMEDRLAEYVVDVGNVDPNNEKDVVRALNMMQIDFSDKDQVFFNKALKEVLGDAYDGQFVMSRSDRSLAFRTPNGLSYMKNSGGGVTVEQSNIPEDFDWDSGEEPPEPTYRDYNEQGELVAVRQYDEAIGDWNYSYKK